MQSAPEAISYIFNEEGKCTCFTGGALLCRTQLGVFWSQNALLCPATAHAEHQGPDRRRPYCAVWLMALQQQIVTLGSKALRFSTSEIS